MVRSSLFITVLISILVLASNLIAAPATVVPLDQENETEMAGHLKHIGDETDDQKMIAVVRTFEKTLGQVQIHLKRMDSRQLELRKEFPLVVKRGDVKRAEEISAELTKISKEQTECGRILLEIKRGLKRADDYFKLRQEDVQREISGEK